MRWIYLQRSFSGFFQDFERTKLEKNPGETWWYRHDVQYPNQQNALIEHHWKKQSKHHIWLFWTQHWIYRKLPSGIQSFYLQEPPRGIYEEYQCSLRCNVRLSAQIHAQHFIREILWDILREYQDHETQHFSWVWKGNQFLGVLLQANACGYLLRCLGIFQALWYPR